MTTYTKAELGTRVLRDLGLIGAEETPSGVDLVQVEETIDAEMALMAAKGITVWAGSSTVIPQEYFTALSRRIGLAEAPSYGLISVAQAAQAIPLVEMELRILSATQPSGAPAQAEYF